MSRKRLIKNKPIEGDYGIYSFKDDNPSQDYLDSDGIAIRYDKFSRQDLYSYSIGDEINEIICDSKIQNALNSSIDALKFTGGSFIEINSMNIKNRGVNSNINDVYFRIYIFSQAFFNPYNTNGSLKSYGQMLSTDTGFRKYKTGTTEQVALFFSQNGPNYGEGNAPGTSLFQNIKIAEDFDSLSVFDQDDSGVVNLNNYDAVFVPEFHDKKYDGFDPKRSMLKYEFNPDDATDSSDIDNPFSDVSDLTTLFQQDGTSNPIYIAIHMDGDMDTTFDKSRNETISIWSLTPDELFELDENGFPIRGKVTTLNWDNHDIERYSNDQDYTAAFTGEALSVTINTLGGVDEESADYNPPPEYKQENPAVTPPISSYNQNQINELILNMLPSNELLKPNDNFNYGSGISEENGYYYTSEFADYLPIPYVELLTEEEKDFQIYYGNKDERILVSAPNVVNLSFDVAVHPEPYGSDELTLFYTALPNNQEDNIDIELYSKFTNQEYEFSNSTTIKNPNNADYIFFVIDWDDRENVYESINDVLANYPETMDELIEKQSENLYIPQYMSNTTQMGLRNKLTNNYNTPGIKTIKTVMISHQTEMDISGVYNSNIEPIRWKLITTRIFLDIPTNEFPDFGQVGGDDYVTIPWPYTTPIIGGVSKDSKYSKSINDILGGGKIGNLDIIDETFLVEARENDELGKNIEKMDLEQVRFFNTGSYDMNTLLEIPSDYYEINDISPSALDDYSFPVFYEEFSSVYSQNYTLVENQVSPSTLSFSNDDVDYWLQHGRPDIAHWIDVNERCLNGEECPKVLDNFGNFLSGNNLPEELYESIYWNSYVNNFNTLFTPTGGQYGQCRTQSDINGDDINDIRYCTPKWPPTSALPTPLEGLFSHGSEDYFFSNIGAPVNYLPSQNQVMGNQWNTWGNAFNPDTGEGGAPPGGYFGPDMFVPSDNYWTGGATGFNNSPLSCPPQTSTYEGIQSGYDFYNFANFSWWYDDIGGNEFCYYAMSAMGHPGQHYKCEFNECTYDFLYTYYDFIADFNRDTLYSDWVEFFYTNIEFNFDEIIYGGSSDDGGGVVWQTVDDLFPPPLDNLTPQWQRVYHGNEFPSVNNAEFGNPSFSEFWFEAFPQRQGSNNSLVEFGSINSDFLQSQATSLWWWVNLSFSFYNYVGWMTDGVNGPWSPNPDEQTLTQYEELLETTSQHIGQEIIKWAQNNFPAQYQDAPLPSGIITDGCDERIPDNHIFINSQGSVLYKFEENQVGIEGIQFDLQNPYTILDITQGGALQDNNWVTNFSNEGDGNKARVVSFKSPAGNSYPIIGCGTLMNLIIHSEQGDWIETQSQVENITAALFPTSLNNSGLQIQYFKPEIGCGDENALNYDSNTTLGYDFNNECNYPTPESADEFTNVDGDSEFLNYPYRYDAVVNGGLYWDGSTIERTYSEDNSVGQIFINDNKDIILSQNCKLEFNTGNITDKTIYDSSGNSNKGLIIGDYKIKKAQKNEQMRRDSYIKTPIRTKENGAL
tara:strand:+ start:2937 stop:7463 length:4527 start_codon:yes stop_codon:yes gene_type:complete